jgi:predicted branched-subunit amino acid permease
MVYSMLHDRSTWIAAAVSGAAAVAAYALPLKLNILVAIASAVVVGLVIDHRKPGPAHAEEDMT